MNDTPEKRFAVGLSFPGGHKEKVREIADILAGRFTRERILFYEYHEAEFARTDLDTYIQDLYCNQTELVVAFICDDYADRRWCDIEWRAIRARANSGDKASIMYLRLDGGNPEGFYGLLDGAADISDLTPQAVAELILQRYNFNKGNPAIISPSTRPDSETFKTIKIQRNLPVSSINKHREEILTCLEDGGIILCPSDTCYSLAVPSNNEKGMKALKELLRLNERPDMPISVSVLNIDEAKKYLADSKVCFKLLETFNNRPMTVVGRLNSKYRNLAAQLGTVKDDSIGIRIPFYSKVELEVASLAGTPISTVPIMQKTTEEERKPILDYATAESIIKQLLEKCPETKVIGINMDGNFDESLSTLIRVDDGMQELQVARYKSITKEMLTAFLWNNGFSRVWKVRELSQQMLKDTDISYVSSEKRARELYPGNRIDTLRSRYQGKDYEFREALIRLIKKKSPDFPTYASAINETQVAEMKDYLRNGEAEDLMRLLEAFFADTNYQIQGDAEKDFQYAMQVILRLTNEYVKVEYPTSNGRIDILVRTKDYIYIIEIKLDKSAQVAINQINDMVYARPFVDDPRTIIKIGVNFSSNNRCIDDWKVEIDSPRVQGVI